MTGGLTERLLAYICDLEAENALLRRTLYEPPNGWSGAFRLPRKMYMIVSTIANAAPRAVHKDAFLAFYDESRLEDPGSSVQAMVSKARKILLAHGIEIKNARHIGYWMLKDHAVRFEALLRAPSSDTDRAA